MIKKIGLILLAFVLGIVLGYGLGKMKPFFSTQKQESSTVLLEKIRKVLQLVTVEASYSNIYTYKDFYGFDVSPLRKKAILKINAKVLVGYDLEKLNFTLDESNHILYLNALPQAEVLSIDPDISYYDISEGYFNSFNEAELTKLNAQAKERIRTEVHNSSDVLDSARNQAEDLLLTLQTIAQAAGWEVRMPPTPLVLP
ncbi:MAG: DUF4230 domain-containing protein [Chitinophagales bacterium]|nr:DUF4230 domain-containing protein [Bacteroidota bacterium]MCB9043371.1 DUF4230 domain-containing protein [Chitinophagales bacterium]